MSKQKNLKHIIGISLSLLCLVVSVLLFMDTKCPPQYCYLFLLPFLYCGVIILFLILIPYEGYSNIGVLFFAAQSSIRCLITPLFMYLGDYVSIFNSLRSEYILEAVFLLIYEQVACIIAIRWALRRRALRHRGWPIKWRIKQIDFTKRTLKRVLILISFVLLVLWITVPTIRNGYTSFTTILESGKKFIATSDAPDGSLRQNLAVLFHVMFKSIRLIVPAFVIVELYNKKASLSHLILSILIVLTQSLFIADAIATALIYMLLLFILLFDLYKKYRLVLYAGMGAAVIAFFVVVAVICNTYADWYGIQGWKQLTSYFLMSYTTGVSNVASVFRAADYSRLKVLIDTLISSIPFNQALFGAEGTYGINVIYEGISGLHSQIIANIACGRYILGPVFAPVFSFCFMYASTCYGMRYRNAVNHWKRIAYLYLTTQFALGVGFYNLPITLSTWMQVGIPLLIMGHISGSDTKEDVSEINH